MKGDLVSRHVSNFASGARRFINLAGLKVRIDEYKEEIALCRYLLFQGV